MRQEDAKGRSLPRRVFIPTADGPTAAPWAFGAGQKLPEGHRLAAERGRVDGLVLANLLRLNQQRAGAGD